MINTLSYHYTHFRSGMDVLIPQLRDEDGEELLPIGAIALVACAVSGTFVSICQEILMLHSWNVPSCCGGTDKWPYRR